MLQGENGAQKSTLLHTICNVAPGDLGMEGASTVQ
jgi:ABC-type Mn2+/Zn2+ transport system ATPase subunit